jgi:hypothetical protein
MTPETRDVMRDNNSIAHLEFVYPLADFDGLTRNLMTQNHRVIQRLKTELVNVRETNSTCFDSKEQIPIFNRRLRDLFDPRAMLLANYRPHDPLALNPVRPICPSRPITPPAKESASDFQFTDRIVRRFLYRLMNAAPNQPLEQGRRHEGGNHSHDHQRREKSLGNHPALQANIDNDQLHQPARVHQRPYAKCLAIANSGHPRREPTANSFAENRRQQHRPAH